MCQSQAEGGRRCAAHTRPGYAEVMGAVKAASDDDRPGLVDAGRMAIIEHATTPAGRKELRADLALFEETFRVFPAKNAEQETARQELFAALHLAQTQAEIRDQIEEEARRRERYARTGTHAEPPQPATLANTRGLL